MISIRVGLLALVAPALGVGQAASPSPAPPAYRGFTPGITYRAFVERARALADSDVLRCNTSPRTAQVMECGVAIRDPSDGATFYLSAHLIEGRADVVSLFDSAGFRDTRGPELVARTKRDLTQVFGRPRALGIGTWEWKYSRKVVRLNWRGRGSARWVSITLMDTDVMDGIKRYVGPAARRDPPPRSH